MTRCVTLLLVLGSLFAITANAGDWPDAEPLSIEQLDSATGRQGISMQWQLNETQQNGLVSGNVLSGPVITGDNRISDHAFDNMNGVATVIQNSGNQVVIQDSTQINILINH